MEICIVSSFSCQHFFELPQREEEEEGGTRKCCSFIFPLLRVPVYLYMALFIFTVHLIEIFLFFHRDNAEGSGEMFSAVVSVKEGVVRLRGPGWS